MLDEDFVESCLDDRNPLFQFAYVPQPQRLEELAQLAEDEPGNWNYRHDPSDRIKPVLHNYLRHTFRRALEQRDQARIATSGTPSSRLVFDTGLMTPHFQAIYGIFTLNRNEGATQPWFLDKFCSEADHDLRHFDQLPEMVTYVDDPSRLVFDFRKRIILNVEHIIEDNLERFPETLRGMPAHALRNLVESAANDSFKRARRNYKVGIPQFYWPRGQRDGRIQILLPLCLTAADRADLALAFDSGNNDYRGSTILTLDMAYNNARLLARPDRDWLDP